ncbi:hypothetical protein ACH5RR_041099 [Cinchona calisaya]|uniref:Uncharacterized protein n=1 Tax=Cinchona calisaya TaxID=153742 RepID=A0ABD2XVN8_9GENT
MGKGSKLLSKMDMLQQLDGVLTEYKKEDPKKRRMDLFDHDKHRRWKKKSIFFELPYWASNLVPHNLDIVLIEETYYDNDNIAELFEIKGVLHDLKQGNVGKYKKIIEKERIFKFLLGLDKSLDEVRGRIIGAKSFPLVHEAFSDVQKEESRMKLMMGTQSSSITPRTLEGSALMSQGTNLNASAWQKKNRLWSKHYRRPCHTRN